jgi:hypothetical protein
MTMYYPHNRPPRRNVETLSFSLFTLIKCSFHCCKLRHLQPERELARVVVTL